MIRLTAVAFGLFVLVARPSGDAPQDRPEGHLLIDAVVLGRDGAPITDLKRDEVEIWIAGYRIPIETFIAITPDTDERSGRSIVLILDDTTLPFELAERTREAARRFVNRVGPLDRLSILTFSGTLLEGAAGAAQLLRSIDAFNVRLSGMTPLDALGAKVLAMLTSVARRFESTPVRRRTIVAIGSAWLFDTPLPPLAAGRDLRREWVEAMRALGSANANFYLIEPSGVGRSPMYGGTGAFTRETGGMSFINTNDLNGAVDRVMREANSYYLFDVRDPPFQRKADLRELDVRVLRSGVTARARKAIPGSQ